MGFDDVDECGEDQIRFGGLDPGELSVTDGRIAECSGCGARYRVPAGPARHRCTICHNPLDEVLEDDFDWEFERDKS